VRPAETIRRLEAAIGARYEYRYAEEHVAEYLHWSVLHVDELGFRAMGKGTTPLLSKAGALAEAAEWLTGKRVDQLPGYLAAHQDSVPEPLVRIEDLLEHVATADDGVMDRVKDLDTSQYWADGWSLLDERPVKVPLEYARLIGGPNGLAAGNRVEEAIVHATNEIFERRAQITVLRNRMVVPTIDPQTIANPVVREQIEFVREQGIEVTIKDLSFDGVLPCVGVYLRDPNIPDTHQFRHFFKVGSSFDREYALQRAFTEYVQGRRRDEFIDGRPEDQRRVLEHDFRALRCVPEDGDNFLAAFMFGFVPLRHAPFLEQGEVIPFEKGTRFGDCLQDIEQARSICRTLGKDYIVVDLTDPDIRFPVVQVIVPGYSDVLPFHPASSPGLFRSMTRAEVLTSYGAI